MSDGLPRWCSGKESAWQCGRCKRHGFDPWIGKISWNRKWQPTPAFFHGKFHIQRSLESYSPWGRTLNTYACVISNSDIQIVMDNSNSNSNSNSNYYSNSNLNNVIQIVMDHIKGDKKSE